LRRSRAELSKDCRGVAATEFAMIVPLMLVMFFGMVEFHPGGGRPQGDSGGADAFRPYVSVDFGHGYRPEELLRRKHRNPHTVFATPTQSTITELYVDPTTLKAKVQWSMASTIRLDGQGRAGSVEP